MRRYTIAKTLALFLGVLSVVARSLPERQLEINTRSPGVHRLSNPLTELDFADGKSNVHQGVFEATTDDVGDPKQRLEGLGLVTVSEGVLNRNIHTATDSMSHGTHFPKRDTTLGKRDDLQGAYCGTLCNNDTGPKPDPSDCEFLYNQIQSNSGTFDLAVGFNGAFISIHGTCAVVFTNNSNDIVTYDWGDFGWLAEWLTDDCLNRRDTTIGVCIFGGSLDRSPYIGVAHPSHFGL